MAIKICPKCSGKVSETRNDCPHCGFIFSENKKCPECEEFIPINSQECPVCGFRFDGLITKETADVENVNELDNDITTDKIVVENIDSSNEDVLNLDSTSENIPNDVSETKNLIENSSDSQINVGELHVCPYCNSNTPYMIGINFYLCMTCRIKYYDIDTKKTNNVKSSYKTINVSNVENENNSISSSTDVIDSNKNVSLINKLNVSKRDNVKTDDKNTNDESEVQQEAIVQKEESDSSIQKKSVEKTELIEECNNPKYDDTTVREESYDENDNKNIRLYMLLHFGLMLFMYFIIIIPIIFGLIANEHYYYSTNLFVALPSLGLFVASVVLSVMAIKFIDESIKKSHIFIIVSVGLFIVSMSLWADYFIYEIYWTNIVSMIIVTAICGFISIGIFVPLLLVFIRSNKTKLSVASFIFTAVSLFVIVLVMIISFFVTEPYNYSNRNDYNKYDGIEYKIYSDFGIASVSHVDSYSTDVYIQSYYNDMPVTKIENGAFSNTSVEYVHMPDTIISIDENAFKNCKKLRMVDLSECLIHIGSYAFSGCESLESLILPNVLFDIGPYAFSNCKSLHSVTIPNGVSSIEAGLFSECNSLEYVAIPDSITNIGSEAFEKCYNLNSISIPNGLEYIGSYAFFDCNSLGNVMSLPNTLNYIDDYAFCDCSINNLSYVGSKTDWINVNKMSSWYYGSQITEINCSDGIIYV